LDGLIDTDTHDMICNDKWHAVPLKQSASLTLKSRSDWALSGDPATAVDVSLPISGALCLFDVTGARRDIKLFPATMKKIESKATRHFAQDAHSSAPL